MFSITISIPMQEVNSSKKKRKEKAKRKKRREGKERKMGDKEKKTGEKSIRFVRRGDRDYPRRLREIPDPPEKLYVLGRLPEENIPAVAVIGARDCTEYGRYVASRLGETLGRKGVQVISGMARGIDGIGQEAALAAGGSSFAVMGSGVDICYPARNRDLYEKLKAGGGILSEYAPGTPAMPHNFPKRNRIVSGLSDAVVVVEAREKSGTLITVDMALEQGREVYAVPGRVTDGLSAGCNRLLKLGAGILSDTEEFLEDLRGICRRRGLLSQEDALSKADKVGQALMETDTPKGRRDKRFALPISERGRTVLMESQGLREIYETLDLLPRSVDQIRNLLSEKYEDRQIVTHLIRLCAENLAVQVSPGKFRLWTD